MNKIIRMIVVLSLIGVLSGGILAVVYRFSYPLIEKQRARAMAAAIFEIFPEAKTHEKREKDVYGIFGQSGNLLGYTLVLQGGGYQGIIKLMVGVSRDLQKLLGLVILESVETPGLGANIESEKFRGQFKNLLTSKPIRYIKNREPDKPDEIEAITGATISTRSVLKIINQGVERWLKAK